MVRELKSQRRGPQKPDAVVVFLHGYGADGEDLIGLAEPLAPFLPNTRFAAPNAPERCANNPMGYQWFPIPWLDGSSPVEAARSAQVAFATLDGWLDGTGMAPERTVLVGFSKGTMMALHVGLRRPVSVAGIVGFSGRLLEPERLAGEITAKPPVLLVHGDADPMVPYASMAEAEAALAAAGVPVATHTSPGVGHGIAPDGLRLAVAFIRERLGMA